MPSPYAKPSQQLFWDLVNRSNPQLKIPLSDANCVIYGYPVSVGVNAASGMRNTKIRLYAKQGMGYKGELTVYYNRLDLSLLFSGFSVKVVNYAANNIPTVVDAFNATYGLNLLWAGRHLNQTQPTWALGMTIPDIASTSGVYSGGSSTIDNTMLYQAVPESLCWNGSAFTIARIKGNPDFSTIITKPEIVTMRRLPVMPAGTYDTALLTWGVDFTDYAASTIKNFLGSTSTRSYQVALAQMLKDVTGLPFAWGNSGAAGDVLDLQGFTAQNYQVTAGAKYYYNTDDFNNCLHLYRDTSGWVGSGWSPENHMGFVSEQDDAAASTVKRCSVFIHYNA